MVTYSHHSQAVITVIKMDTLPESAQNQSPVENVRDKDI